MLVCDRMKVGEEDRITARLSPPGHKCSRYHGGKKKKRVDPVCHVTGEANKMSWEITLIASTTAFIGRNK